MEIARPQSPSASGTQPAVSALLPVEALCDGDTMNFHFHTKDGRYVDDSQGADLKGMDQALDRAVQMLAEQLRGNSKLLLDTGDFSIIVKDDDGLSLFTIDLSRTMSPASGRRR
jgi:hypothetical protein